MPINKKYIPEKRTKLQETKDHFAVILEDIQSNFKVFGEVLGATRESVEGIREELVDFKEEMTEFKTEMVEFKEEMTEFKTEMVEFKEETNLRFNLLETKMENKFKALNDTLNELNYELQEIKKSKPITTNQATFFQKQLDAFKEQLKQLEKNQQKCICKVN